MGRVFASRRKAGEILATKLIKYRNRPDVIVLGLPRGGVPVAYEVACMLNAPLDVFMVRKLGVPGEEELAFGAIATGGVRVLNEDLIESLGISKNMIHAITRQEQKELKRRKRLYRGDRLELNVQGRVVILVDDGLATGSSMRAALVALRQMQPSGLTIAVPVGAPATCDEFRGETDEVICAITPDPFLAVGQWYEDFSQTSDEEVRELLQSAAAHANSSHSLVQ
jgi:putative phosphoribosyl transferase